MELTDEDKGKKKERFPDALPDVRKREREPLERLPGRDSEGIPAERHPVHGDPGVSDTVRPPARPKP
jgi:hypothetical protein